ncbi:uncharacterized protein [Diadema setosum]|uniref:uncharacterized protein n=1 Tax=Diadema setosum TaxID=31175 RepID=UPI003B3A409A
MTGYYRKFCHNFADAATPLTNMLRKDSQFEWSDDCQVAFNRLKAMLASSPVLAAPNFDKQFILMVDASILVPRFECNPSPPQSIRSSSPLASHARVRTNFGAPVLTENEPG